MISPLTYTTAPTFSPSGTRISPDSTTLNNGYSPGVEFPAQHANYLFYGLSYNANEVNPAINSVISELDYLVTSAGLTLNSGDNTQVAQAVEAYRDNATFTNQNYFTIDHGAGYNVTLAAATTPGYLSILSGGVGGFLYGLRVGTILSAGSITGASLFVGGYAVSVTAASAINQDLRTTVTPMFAGLSLDVSGGHLGLAPQTTGPNIIYSDKTLAINQTGQRTLFGTLTDDGATLVQIAGSASASSTLVVGGVLYATGGIAMNSTASITASGGVITVPRVIMGSLVDDTTSQLQVNGQVRATGNVLVGGYLSGTSVTVSNGITSTSVLGYGSFPSLQLNTGKAGFVQTALSLSPGATFLLVAGTWFFEASSMVILQVYVNGAWTSLYATATVVIYGGMIISDGVNMRVINTKGSTITAYGMQF